MMKLLRVVSKLLGLIADFMWAPIVRAHIREVSLRVPIFPGQAWELPMLGIVTVSSVTDFHVSYRILDDPDEEHTSRRQDFAIHAVPVTVESSNDDKNGKVIRLNLVQKDNE
jgi:hypothetical protein